MKLLKNTLRKKSRRRKILSRRYNGGAAWDPHTNYSSMFTPNAIKEKRDKEERDKAERANTMLREIEHDAPLQLLGIAQTIAARPDIPGYLIQDHGWPRPMSGPASDPIPGTAFAERVRDYVVELAAYAPPINEEGASFERLYADLQQRIAVRFAYETYRNENKFPYTFGEQKTYARRIISMIVKPGSMPRLHDNIPEVELFIAKLMAFLVRLTRHEFVSIDDAIKRGRVDSLIQGILYILNCGHSSLCGNFFDGVTLIRGA